MIDVASSKFTDRCDECIHWDTLNECCLIDCVCLESMWESNGDYE